MKSDWSNKPPHFACSTISIDAYCNLDRDLFVSLFEEHYVHDLFLLPAGEQVFRGIPFSMPPEDAAKRWISVGKAITIPVKRPATYVVVAHACLPVAGQVGWAEMDLWADVGEALGRYTIVYEDGREVTETVRRRFEVSEFLKGLTPPSFSSVPHGRFPAVDWRGPHDRQSEPQWGLPGSSSMKALPGSWAVNLGGVGYDLGDGESTYWLWAIPTLGPDQEISEIRIESARPEEPTGLIVGGITCFPGETDPFRFEPAKTLLVTGADPYTEVEMAVDLGVVSSPRQALTPIDADPWLAERFQGWGDREDSRGKVGVLLEVAGTSDATLYLGTAAVPLRSITEESTNVVGQYRIEVLQPAAQRVRVAMVDARTGRGTPARVHVHAADGRYLPPDGHRAEINLALMEDYGADIQIGTVGYAYVDGSFEICLPYGKTYWEISRGFETEPIRREIDIDSSTSELRFELTRWSNLRSNGWVSADTHVHFVSPPTALLEARAEDLNFVHVLATQWGYFFSSFGDFPAGDLVHEDTETAVFVGQEQRQPMLGHMSLLRPGSHIFPVGHGGEPTSPFGEPLSVLMADWADRCREQGGLVVSPHFPYPYGELVADVVLEKLDAIEIFGLTSEADGPRVRDYYRLLNCGYKVPLVGGTDKMSAGTPVGAVRTYARLLPGESFGFESWARAVRAGRTFQTSGPILSLEVESQELGSTLNLSRHGGTVMVEARAAAAYELGRLEVVVNGVVVSYEDARGSDTIHLAESLQIDRSSWISARCTTPYHMRTAFPTAVGAHTSPIYVQCGNERQLDLVDAQTLLAMIDGGVTWLKQIAIAHDPDRERMVAYFERAADNLRNRMARLRE